MTTGLEVNLSFIWSIGIELLFLVTILIFTLYTTFLGYHWFAYGTSRAKSMRAMAIYLLVSAPLIMIMAIMLIYI